MKQNIKCNEEGLPTLGSFPGMGNPTVPTENSSGSGDKFSFNDKKNKSKNLKTFKEFLKTLEESQ